MVLALDHLLLGLHSFLLDDKFTLFYLRDLRVAFVDYCSDGVLLLLLHFLCHKGLKSSSHGVHLGLILLSNNHFEELLFGFLLLVKGLPCLEPHLGVA